MELIQSLISFILNVDEHLDWFCQNYGLWTYGLLFLIVFCETGLVVTPFLPGDSLLFAVGALCARGSLDLLTSMVLLFIAAVVGDFVNYWIGAKIGKKIIEKDRFFLKKAHIDRTHAFYEKYGGKAIVYARFVPIVRTVAPFVAGLGAMSYRKFVIFNIGGALLWVLTMVGAGYIFGSHPFVKKNFELVVLGIIGVSLMPIVWEAVRAKLESRKSLAPQEEV